MLDEVLAATPASLQEDVAAALAAGQAAHEELARMAAGEVGLVLARGGLPAALLDLAGSAGAEADVRIDCDIDGDVAIAAWFAASEALANALKHAGPARIWLSAVAEGACLRVQVADDGVGGADPGGRGLRGLGATIEQVADPVNANARGAAMLAAVAVGELDFDQVPDRVQVARSYVPDPTDSELYDELFGEFVGLYRRNRKAHARLNRDRAGG